MTIDLSDVISGKPEKELRLIKAVDPTFTGKNFSHLQYEFCHDAVCLPNPTDYDCKYVCAKGSERQMDLSSAFDIRRAFVPSPGFVWVSIDYSQIELRAAANIAPEPEWVTAFLTGVDVHTQTAKALFNTENPTEYERKLAKVCNFGSLYGGSAYTIAQQTGVSVEVAEKVYEGWINAVPGLMAWIKAMHRIAREYGFVKTVYGRKRDLTQWMQSKDYRERGYGERSSVSHMIQGCLQGNSRVLTDKGYFKIKDLYEKYSAYESIDPTINPIPDLKVWTGKRWAKFTVLNRGKAELVNLTLGNGKVVNVDARHKFFTHDSENPLNIKEVNVSSYLADGTDRHYVQTPAYLEWQKGLKSTVGSHTIPVHAFDYACVLPSGKAFEFVSDFGEFSYTCPDTGSSYRVSSSRALQYLWYRAGALVGSGGFTEDTVYLDVDSNSGPFTSTNLDRDFNLRRFTEVLGEDSYDDVELIPKRDFFRKQLKNPALVKALEWLGFSYFGDQPLGKLPERIFFETVRNRAAFVQGLWDSQGVSLAKNGSKMQFTSKQFVQDLCDLYSTLGLSGRVSNAMNWGFNCYLTNISVDRQDPTSFGLTNGGLSYNPPLYSPDDLDQVDYIMPNGYGRTKIVYTQRLGVEEDTYTLSVDDPDHSFIAQGMLHKNTAADIMKIAMLKVDKAIRKHGWEDDCKMLLTIHDEIDFEIRESKLAEIISVIRPIMELKRPDWPVPFLTDVEVGRDWGSVSKYDVVPSRFEQQLSHENDYPVLLVPRPLNQSEAQRMMDIINNAPGSVKVRLQYEGSDIIVNVRDFDEVAKVLRATKLVL